MRRTAVILASVTALLLLASPAIAGGRPFHVTLTGAAEAPGPGDPDGTGSGSIWLNQGLGQVCFDINVFGVDALAAAHIHIAPAGAPGPVVVPLIVSGPENVSGCVDVDAGLIKAIRQNPEAYYVNVHNAAFPAGALRAQLAK